ncbi:apolipoprotein N-acyltransferase [Desulfovibrio sp. OttesenSCG-928-O18]|nr:apolipoprotein N-acyltransferase [Desulfovibrio sp. OttesenSCG-928-O18]
MSAYATLTVPEKKALRRIVLCLAVLGGAGMFLGYANPVYQLPPLALFLPACLAVFARIMPTGKGTFYAGWLCATIGSSACLYWVSVPMHDFGGLPWPLTVPPILALGGYLGLYGGLFAWLYRFFREHLPFPAALLLAAPLWTALDIAKGWLFTGFPWISLASAFLPWSGWVKAASFVGADMLSGLFALAAVAIAEARPVRLGFSHDISPKKRRTFCYSAVFVPMLFIYGLGLLPPLPEGRSVAVGLIQGNVDQNQKWEPAYQAATLERYLTLSEWTVNPALGRVKQPAELVVWPETSMPFYLETNEELAGRIAYFSRKFGVPVAFGAPGKSARANDTGYYNRLWLQTPSAMQRQSYDKTHLVPFGEYVPLNIPLPFIEYFTQGLEFLSGSGEAPLISGDLALGALICYEAIFPDLAQKRVARGANLLVNISNDAWFGKTAAPVQHLHLTAMRAIEQGRYIVRATNTGISAIITPDGRLAAHGSLFRAEALVGTAKLVEGVTFYHRAAPFFFWACLLLTLSAATACLKKRHDKNNNAPGA